jgi:hypothetical protein
MNKVILRWIWAMTFGLSYFLNDRVRDNIFWGILVFCFGVLILEYKFSPKKRNLYSIRSKDKKLDSEDEASDTEKMKDWIKSEEKFFFIWYVAAFVIFVIFVIGQTLKGRI